MRDLPRLQEDTPLEVESIWLAGLRAHDDAWRMRRTAALTSACWRWAIAAFERTHPGATPAERDAFLLEQRYGKELADRVMEHCRRIGWHER